MVYVERGHHWLGVAVHQLGEGVLGPMGVSLLWLRLLLHLLPFLGVRRRFSLGGEVIDDMARRLNPNRALIVEALSASSTSDLLELANGQDTHALTVVLE